MLFAALGFAVLALGSTALAGSAGVKITSTGFDPATVSIQSGDSVNWTNSDNVRHEVKVVGSSCTLSLEPAQTGSCAFPSAGTFAYTDPGSGFSGTVSVAPNSRSVSLTPSRTLNIFGDAVTLSGTVSSKAAGEKVTVFSRPAGLPETQTIVTTTARRQLEPAGAATRQDRLPGSVRHGLQSAGDRLDSAADHAAEGRAAPVPDPRSVRPLDGRQAGQHHPLAARARLCHVQDGHAASDPSHATTSDAYFTAFVRLGTKLRIFMPASEVGSDYFAAHSNFVVN